MGPRFFMWPDFWIPMVNEQQIEGSSYLKRTVVRITRFGLLGRLKPGVTPQQATENLNMPLPQAQQRNTQRPTMA